MKTFGSVLESMGKSMQMLKIMRAMSNMSSVQRKGFIRACEDEDVKTFNELVPALTAEYNIFELCQQVVDRDFCTRAEVAELTEKISKAAVEDVFDIIETPIHNAMLYTLRGKAYHLPSTQLVRPDWYALNLCTVPAKRLNEVSSVLESNGADDSAVRLHFSHQTTLKIPEWFITNTLGLEYVPEISELLVSWAFTKVHVKDAWLTANVMLGRSSIHELADMTGLSGFDVDNIIAGTLRTLRKVLHSPLVQNYTPMSAVEREVSQRLFRTINKAAYFEELIDNSTMTIKPSTTSTELVEELLAYCKKHGYPDATIEWAPKKGVVIKLKGV